MIRSIAFVHTVALLIDRFRPRFQAELPQQRCFHMLDESVLQDLLRDGPSPTITRRIVTLATLAADAGAESVERAAELMAGHAIHSLPVLSQQGHLIGIVTTTDIMAGFLRSADANTAATSAERAATGACTRERLDILERVAREARRYLNAGQDERLHAALTKAILSLDRVDEQKSGNLAPILGLGRVIT